MNFRYATITLTALALLHGASRAATIPLECIPEEPGGPQQNIPSFILELSGDTLAISGVVLVNCCAKKTIDYTVDQAQVGVTIDKDALCECMDVPCSFTATIPGCSGDVYRVAIESNFGQPLLDTFVIRPPSASAGTIDLVCDQGGASELFALEFSTDTLVISGTVSVNCCAEKTIVYAVGAEDVLGLFDINAACRCANTPCPFVAKIPGVSGAQYHVVLRDNDLGTFGRSDVLLDTVVTRPGGSIARYSWPHNGAAKEPRSRHAAATMLVGSNHGLLIELPDEWRCRGTLTIRTPNGQSVAAVPVREGTHRVVIDEPGVCSATGWYHIELMSDAQHIRRASLIVR